MSSLGAIDSLPYPAPTPPSKPTVVIVPGAFHTAAHFHPLSRYLERQDSKSIIMRLPSSWQKASTPTAGMAEDVNSIRRLIEELVWDEEGGDGKWGGTADADDEDEKKGSRDTTAKTNDDKNHPSTFYFPYRDISTPRPITPDPGKKDVVLVMHASGAVSGCQAITGLSRTQRKQLGKKGGVIGLFFICGLLVSEGESLESTMLGMGEATVPEFAELDGSILRPANAAAFFYGDLPSEEAARWVLRLEPQVTNMNSTVVRDSCWELDVPVTCVTCSKDPRVRVTEAMVAKMKKENWTVNTMECGCSPFLSHVEELGEMILKAGQMG